MVRPTEGYGRARAKGDVLRKWWLWILLAVLVILVLGLIFGSGYRRGTPVGAPAGPVVVRAA